MSQWQFTPGRAICEPVLCPPAFWNNLYSSATVCAGIFWRIWRFCLICRSGLSWFIPWVMSARSTCRVITEPAGACPFGGTAVRNNPTGVKAGGVGGCWPTSAATQPGGYLLTPRNPPENPRDTVPSEMSSRCVTLTQRGYGNLFIVMRITAAELWPQFNFTRAMIHGALSSNRGGSIRSFRAIGWNLLSYFTRIPRDRRGLVMLAVINQCLTGSGPDVGWACREFFLHGRIRFCGIGCSEWQVNPARWCAPAHEYMSGRSVGGAQHTAKYVQWRQPACVLFKIQQRAEGLAVLPHLSWWAAHWGHHGPEWNTLLS